MTYSAPYTENDVPWTEDPNEARHRARHFQALDPFPNIAPALLSAAHISDYARVTCMIHPFSRDARQRLKGASYEARPKRFIRWDDDGRKLISPPFDSSGSYRLPANSITFAQIESRISLPSYMAMRFNLRIKHVHRGLLLGTGPLVDPEFEGDILIPLHNLTSDDYEITLNEGLIWIEFTKTSRVQDIQSTQGKIEEHKKDVSFETYFERANANNPIRSSIPSAIKEARELSRGAERSARMAKRTNQIFAGIGVAAIVATGLAFHTYFQQINANVIAANSLAATVKDSANDAKAEAKTAEREIQTLRSDLDAANLRIQSLENEVKHLSGSLQK